MSQGVESLKKRGTGSVEKFVPDAEDAPSAGSGGLLPVAVSADFPQRNAVSCTAPRGNDDVWIQSHNFFGQDLLAGDAQEASASSFHQLRNPGLRSDQWFPPLFAENFGLRGMTQAGPDLIMECLYVTLHLANNFLAAFTDAHCSGDC